MTTRTRPEPPPEAALIQAALKRKKMAARAAARASGISDARWRQIISGYQTVAGNHIPVRAPSDTLARMARAVGVTAGQLREADREDAAAELEEIDSLAPEQGDYTSDPHIDAIAALLATLPPEVQDEVVRRVREPRGEKS